MRRFLLSLALLLGLTAPAAAVTIPGCGDFTLFAKDDINMENGTLLLNGDVFLQNATGEVHVGAKNRIKGTIFANQIFLGTGAVVDNCVANVIIGDKGTCLTKTTGAGSFGVGVQPASCFAQFPPASPDFQNTSVDACVATAAAISVATNQTLDIAELCAGKVRLFSDSKLRLLNTLINMKRLQLDSNSALDGIGLLPTFVNVLGVIKMGGGVELSNLILRSQEDTGDVISVGLGALLDNVLLLAPNGKIHVHTGALLNASSVVAQTIAVEPATFFAPPPPPICTCPAGFHPAAPVACVPN
jgi:hypothetical protein